MAGIGSKIKASPVTLATITATIAALTSILGTAFFIDARYAHADEVRAAEADAAHALKSQKRNMRREFLTLRSEQLDDKVFELKYKQASQKSKFNALDAAMLDRYERNLRDVQAEIQQLENK